MRSKLRKKTANDYYFRIRRLLEYTGYKLSVESISRFLEGIKLVTVRIYKAALKHFVEFLKERGHNVDNIYQEINRRFPWKSPEYNIFNIVEFNLTKEDIVKGFHGIKKFKNKVFYAFLAVTGMRRGEALEVRVKHLDLKNRIVRMNYERRSKRFYLSFFTPEVRDMIMIIIKDEDLKEEDIIFDLSDRQLKRTFREASIYAGKKISPQRLRKFFATYSIQNGMEPLEVDFLQGRVSKSILIKHYFSPNILKLRERYDRVWKKFKFEDF